MNRRYIKETIENIMKGSLPRATRKSRQSQVWRRIYDLASQANSSTKATCTSLIQHHTHNHSFTAQATHSVNHLCLHCPPFSLSNTTQSPEIASNDKEAPHINTEGNKNSQKGNTRKHDSKDGKTVRPDTNQQKWSKKEDINNKRAAKTHQERRTKEPIYPPNKR